MRGKDHFLWCTEFRRRITPAYAGKRTLSVWRSAFTLDHPRVCGEKPLSKWGQDGPLGSPPRMRGKVLLILRVVFLDRITPAHAGKRSEAELASEGIKDHPRACGEKNVPEVVFLPVGGSPPRMRGKDKQHIAVNNCAGITPAHAGKSV